MERLCERETDRGSIVVNRVRPGLLVSTATGYLDHSFADLLIRVGTEENELVPGFAHYMDFREVTGYDGKGRRACTEWALAQVAPHPRLGLLTSSKIVHMGTSAAAMAFALAGRKLESFTDPAEFDAAIAKAKRIG